MGDIRAALRSLILSDAGITALIGNRLFATFPEQGAQVPFMQFQRVSEQSDIANTGPTGLDRARFQISVWGSSPDQANQVSELVRVKINGFAGTVAYGSNSPQDSVVIRGIFVDSVIDLHDDVSKFYGTSRDYFVWFADR